MATAVGVTLGVLGVLFCALCTSGLSRRLAAARAARRWRRARRLLTPPAPGGAAGRRDTASRPDPLTLAGELAEILASDPPGGGSEAAPTAPAALGKEVVAQLARRADEWHRRPRRRRRLRAELLAGLALLEELSASDDLALIVRLLYLPDALIVARAAAVVAQRPAAYAVALVPLAGVLRTAAPLTGLYVQYALRTVAAAHPEMIPLLAADPSALVRRSIVWAAGTALEDPAPRDGWELRDRLEELIVAGARDSEPAVRVAACRALALSPSARRLSELKRLLDDDSVSVRIAAVRSFRGLEDPRAIRPLVARLKGATPTLTREILQTLSALPRSGIHWLVGRLVEPESGTRVAALRALGAMGGEAEASKIVQLAEDPNPRVRLEAFLALAAIGRVRGLPLRGTAVVERLCRRLPLERDELVAAALVEALASSADARSTELLIARIQDSSPMLREQLVEGLALSNLLTTADACAAKGATDRASD